MKKVIAILLVLILVFSFAACGGSGEEAAEGDALPITIGVVLVGDENEGYTAAHIEGIKTAAANLGIAEDQIIWKYTIGEDETCYDACVDLVDSGCNFIITNSYGHQSYCQQAASENPEVVFVAMTGDTAAGSGLDNFYNAFTNVYESRFVSGVVAGMKLAELVANNEVPETGIDADGNYKVGYVGALPYAEVVSGYTAFFLGVKSIVPNVAMEVYYTNTWADQTAEASAEQTLIADGCVITSQHADTTGAPGAAEAALQNGGVIYHVGYNVDMLSVAPTAALTSATNEWGVYYEEAFAQFLEDGTVPQDWAKGYDDNAVAITALGDSCAEGTADKVAEIEAAIKDGSLHVFDCSTWTSGGATLDSYTSAFGFEGNELISDGYFHESELRSAPAFDIRIDGITEMN